MTEISKIAQADALGGSIALLEVLLLHARHGN